jgi:KAP family P-loop domain
MERNQEVKDYLTYYIAFPHPPGFAVMLNGPWGIGKTYLLKEFLRSIAAGGVKYVYVSLYGLTSFDEIDDALFRATYPLLDNKGIQLAGRAAKALGKFFRIDLDLGAKDILNKANADLFVFDDLERCDIPVSRVLGYINEFIEHEDRKVIIVANEKEIKGGDDYGRIREKVIGKTFVIQSVLEQALEGFTGSVGDKRARDFLASKLADISTIYHQSELHNLRVLQQTMWDFERFFLTLGENHRGNDDAMTALLRLLFALSFELKAGRLTVVDLNDRQSSILGALVRSPREGGAESGLATAQQRYPGADLDGTTLSDETLIDLLVKGIVDGEKIRAELDVSSFFVTVADEPAWRTVWHAYDRTEDEFNAALAEMERAFAAREFVLIGEILHVLGLRLWLSGIGVLMKTRAEVVDEGKCYINDLYSEGRIEPASPRDRFSDLSLGGYAGLGIHENETSEYKKFYAYLHEVRQAAGRDQYPTIAKEILRDMAEDPDRFLLRVINGEANDFYDVPILAAIDPNCFVKMFLNHHPAQQRTVLNALKARYERGNLDRDLAAERPWANEVRGRLLAASEGMSLITRYRIRQSLKYALDGVLGVKDADREVTGTVGEGGA